MAYLVLSILAVLMQLVAWYVLSKRTFRIRQPERVETIYVPTQEIYHVKDVHEEYDHARTTRTSVDPVDQPQNPTSARRMQFAQSDTPSVVSTV